MKRVALFSFVLLAACGGTAIETSDPITGNPSVESDAAVNVDAGKDDGATPAEDAADVDASSPITSDASPDAATKDATPAIDSTPPSPCGTCAAGDICGDNPTFPTTCGHYCRNTVNDSHEGGPGVYNACEAAFGGTSSWVTTPGCKDPYNVNGNGTVTRRGGIIGCENHLYTNSSTLSFLCCP